MLLSSVETYNDEQTRLVANFAEALKIEKDELKYMALLAKAVLEQNLSAYVTAEENRSFSVPNSVVKEYIGVLIKGNVCQNDNMTLIHSTVPSDMNTEKLDIVKKAETPIIKLSNVQLSLEQYELVFEGYEFVILENCVFSNGSSYSIHFRQCKNVKIISCKFVDFRVRTIMMRDVEAIYFENTMFENCELQYRRSTDDWKILGGVIYTDRPQSVGENKFVNCIFENCGGRNTENYYSTQFISNCKSTLDGCKFNNCWNYRDTNRVDTDDERRRMFPANSSALNCTNIDSANII